MTSIRTLCVLGILVSLVANTACAGEADRRVRLVDPAKAAVVEGSDAFALELYARLSAEQGNLFFSPYSIHTALAMTYAGAKGNTAQQMADVLHYTLPQEKLHPAFAAIMKDLNTGGTVGEHELYKLAVANAIWAQQGYPFHKEFQQLVQTNYGAGLHTVDFERATEAARRQINQWVEKQTNDKIQDLVPEGVLNNLTRMVLTNAIYFKSAWGQPFKKEATEDQPFHLSGIQSVLVPTMSQQQRTGYLEGAGFQAVDLPYAGGRLSMVVLVPRQVDGLPELEKALAGGRITWRGMQAREVAISLPRFKMTSQFSLSDSLKAMGMTDAFSDTAADFSGIASGQKLHIQAVLHKAFVDVNEEGTEAAAATAVAIGLRAAPIPQEPVVIKADRPFLFLIQHRPTGQILFLGRVADPRHNG